MNGKITSFLVWVLTALSLLDTTGELCVPGAFPHNVGGCKFHIINHGTTHTQALVDAKNVSTLLLVVKNQEANTTVLDALTMNCDAYWLGAKYANNAWWWVDGTMADIIGLDASEGDCLLAQLVNKTYTWKAEKCGKLHNYFTIENKCSDSTCDAGEACFTEMPCSTYCVERIEPTTTATPTTTTTVKPTTKSTKISTTSSKTETTVGQNEDEEEKEATAGPGSNGTPSCASAHLVLVASSILGVIMFVRNLTL